MQLTLPLLYTTFFQSCQWLENISYYPQAPHRANQPVVPMRAYRGAGIGACVASMAAPRPMYDIRPQACDGCTHVGGARHSVRGYTAHFLPASSPGMLAAGCAVPTPFHRMAGLRPAVPKSAYSNKNVALRPPSFSIARRRLRHSATCYRRQPVSTLCLVPLKFKDIARLAIQHIAYGV